ncbi:MAG: leucine-rich repeat domain-containing protein [Roseburia sp.]|nr:leucine-rich repeat domain-containing protein [Roseburia sp.]
METFAFPAGLTKIESALFSDCTALKELNIPANIAEIGDAFSGCPLEKFEFRGTLKQWESVEKEKQWNDGMPKIAIDCTAE